MLLNTHLLDLSWSVSFSSSAMKCSLGSRGGFPSCKGTWHIQQTAFLTLAQCSLSWLHILDHLPIPNSTKVHITHLSATFPEQFHNTQEIQRMKGTIPHGMTRLTGFCLCTLKQSMLPAPETLSLESAALYWASLFGTITFWAFRHPFNTKPSSVKSSSAQLHC